MFVRHKEREIVIVAASATSPADSATVTGLFHHQHRVCFGFSLLCVRTTHVFEVRAKLGESLLWCSTVLAYMLFDAHTSAWLWLLTSSPLPYNTPRSFGSFSNFIIRKVLLFHAVLICALCHAGVCVCTEQLWSLIVIQVSFYVNYNGCKSLQLFWKAPFLLGKHSAVCKVRCTKVTVLASVTGFPHQINNKIMLLV